MDRKRLIVLGMMMAASLFSSGCLTDVDKSGNSDGESDNRLTDSDSAHGDDSESGGDAGTDPDSATECNGETCKADSESDSGGDTDTDTDTDTDGDVDTDTDADVDADTDVDADSDTDADGDADGGFGSDSDAPSTDETDSPFDDGTDTDTTAICAKFSFDVKTIPARIMVVQDKSGSMDENNKWGQAYTAIKHMVEAYQDRIAFGIDLFNIGSVMNANSCEVGEAAVEDVSLYNAKSILKTLLANVPNGATPIYSELRNFTDPAYAPTFLNREAESWLVVVTDGKDTCGTEGTYNGGVGAGEAELAEVTADLLARTGVKTVVIGFGTGVDPDQLNAVAEAGGTEFTKYFKAGDGDALADALDTVVQSILVSCTYDIGEQDAEKVDLDYVNIRVNGELIGRDDGCAKGEGWMWTDDSRTAVELCEETCDLLKQSASSSIKGEIACNPEDIILVV